MSFALMNGLVFENKKLVKKNILIRNGKIIDVSKKKVKANSFMDCRGKIILPGAIDSHVHFREPGFEYKEDFFSGSMAAIHGGVTTIMEMPNTKPAVTTTEILAEKKAIAQKKCMVNFGLFIGAGESNLKEIERAKPIAIKLYYGSTTGNMVFNDEGKILDLFRVAKKKNLVVAVHAEDEELMKKNEKKFAQNNVLMHPKIRSEEVEAIAIKKVLEMQKKIGNKIHICHVSSKKGLELVKKAKKRKNGKMITCETTPNYLFLDASDYKKLGNLMKCNPAIKEKKHKEALWKGFVKGEVDLVATDHAPHSPEEKRKPYREAPSGIPGVETLYPLLIDSALRKKITLKRVVEAICENPARIYGWKKKGFIKKGFDADLVVVDPKKTRVLRGKELFTKAGYTPFEGKRLLGTIEKTIIGGNAFG